MKKLIFLAAAVAAIASCAKVETTSLAQPEEISFKTYNPAMTKAGTYSEQADLKLGVDALWVKADPATTKQHYFTNTLFTKDETGSWTANPKQYWPKDGYLTFTVYAPQKASDVTITSTDDATGKIVFKKTSENEDFVYGVKMYSFGRQSNSVPVQLKHAGAKITVNAKNHDGTFENLYRIDKITINQIILNGTATVEYTAKANPVLKWSNPTPQADFTSSPAAKITGTDQTLVDINVLPAANLGDVDVKAKVTVEYSIRTDPDTYLTCTPETWEVAGITAWEGGKHYIFNITFTANEITFAPTVENWTDVIDNHTIDTGEVPTDKPIA